MRRAPRSFWIGVLVLAAGGSGGCPVANRGGGGGAAGAGTTTGPAAIDAACVLMAEGGICSFTNRSNAPAARCVKVLYGAAAGTVVASNDVCTGRLWAGAVSTIVVRFPERPADHCGSDMADCRVKVVEPAAAPDVMVAWQAELEASYSGPLTAKDCEKLVKRRYEFYGHEDCRGLSPPDKAQCEKQVADERDRELPYLVQDCVGYYSRDLYKCTMEAKTLEELYRCEDLYMR